LQESIVRCCFPFFTNEYDWNRFAPVWHTLAQVAEGQ
jgi:hypothetical protein